jgi:hypothetical protein
MHIQNNEGQLRNEESKLASTRRDMGNTREKKRTIEDENVDPEPTDVLALVFFFLLFFLFKCSCISSD